MDGLLIRKATEEDLPELLALYQGLEQDPATALSLDSAKEKFRKMGTYPRYFLYLAELRGDIVGAFELLIMDNLAHGGKPSGIVEDIVVREGRRGMGIGKAMMRYAMQVCRTEGCYKLVLSSNVSRKDAHAFYQALGFKVHGYSFQVNFGDTGPSLG